MAAVVESLLFREVDMVLTVENTRAQQQELRLHCEMDERESFLNPWVSAMMKLESEKIMVMFSLSRQICENAPCAGFAWFCQVGKRGVAPAELWSWLIVCLS